MTPKASTPASRTRSGLAVIAIVLLLTSVVQVVQPQAAEAATNTGIAVCSADLNTIEVGSSLGYFATVYASLYRWNGSAWVGPVKTLTGTESVKFSGLSNGYYTVAVWLYGGWTGYQWQRVATSYSIYDTGFMFVGTRPDWCFV